MEITPGLAWLCGCECWCLLLWAKESEVEVTFECELGTDSGFCLSILLEESTLEYDSALPCPAIAKTTQFHSPSLMTISCLYICLYRDSLLLIIFGYHVNLTRVRPEVSRCSPLSQSSP